MRFDMCSLLVDIVKGYDISADGLARSGTIRYNDESSDERETKD